MSYAAKPKLEAIIDATFAIAGEIGRRLEAVTKNWILPAPYENPAMIEMFRNRDQKPYQDQVGWAGEFAGKYLTHSVQIYRLTHDEELRRHIAWFVNELVALQAEDGYLGPWPKEWRLRRGGPSCYEPWDAWGHYHIMLGLILWHTVAGDKQALRCAMKMGDLLCNRFLGTDERLHDTGAHEMNMAPIHSLCLLYALTGERRYLDMAHEIEREFEIPPAGDYIRSALAGKEFYQMPKPRWESLHPIQGIAELYFITGEEKYRKAFEHIWWSILKGDRHNNGGFSSGEQATGDPYHRGAIETCCTVAWMALSVDMLRMTGNSIVADELELSLFNSGVGMMSPSGHWVTYDTPMDGKRCASTHTIAFQARAGSPELSCCSVNGPRAIGMTSEWALMRSKHGLVLNYYGPSTMEAALSSGTRVKITQVTDYPRDNRIELVIEPHKKEDFSFDLRIPYWSEDTTVTVNGKPVTDVRRARYLRLHRTWSKGDRVTIEFDFRFHFWADGEYVHYENWETEWRIFGPIANDGEPGRGREALPCDHLASMPESIDIDGATLTPRVLKSVCGSFDFRNVLVPNSRFPIVCCYTEYDAPQDMMLPIAFGADWWAAWFVNGKKVYDSHETGNQAMPYLRTHLLELPLKKGKNLIAFRVTSGSGGWTMTMGRRALSRPGLGKLYRTSIYRGPILLAYDPRYNETAGEEIPPIAAKDVRAMLVEDPTWLKPWMLLEVKAADGRTVRLSDFGSAGAAGNMYLSWLPVRFDEPPGADFTPNNPLRSFRMK
jgi:DUF1680 family protein